MSLISPSQSAAGETIDAADINTPINQLAGILNGNIDNDNISTVSGTKIGTGTIPTGAYADASITNAKLSTTAGEVGGAWLAWTPTLANWTVGANAVDAKYTKIGKTVIFRLYWKFGAGASVGSAPTFSLPVTSVTYPGTAEIQVLAQGYVLDAGVGAYGIQANWKTTTTAILQVFGVGATYPTAAAFDSTVPMTWATNDELYVQGTYEAA